MRPWSEEEISLLVSKLGNMTVPEISKLMGRSTRSIMSRANYLGYRTNLTTNGTPARLSNPRVKRSKFVFTPAEQREMSLIKLLLTKAQSQAAIINRPANVNLELLGIAYRQYKAMAGL